MEAEVAAAAAMSGAAISAAVVALISATAFIIDLPEAVVITGPVEVLTAALT